MKNTLTNDVIAYVNNNGETIYRLWDEDGSLIEMKSVDDRYKRLTNDIKEMVRPQDMVVICYRIKDGQLIGININENGCDIPSGEESKPLMNQYINHDGFENDFSLNQDLTFVLCTRFFKQSNVRFDRRDFSKLGIQQAKRKGFSNLGLLLSDQCPFTIKVGIFSDDMNTDCIHMREFGGSLLEQVQNAYHYIDLYNRNHLSIIGLNHVTSFDYPKIAIREALVNAVVHRDYRFSGSTIVNINEKAIEFISIGGLVNGLTLDDIANGMSQSRNPKLADIFHQLRLSELNGTGIRRIKEQYSKYPVQPGIKVGPNSFRIVLPNINSIKSQDTMRTAR